MPTCGRITSWEEAHWKFPHAFWVKVTPTSMADHFRSAIRSAFPNGRVLPPPAQGSLYDFGVILLEDAPVDSFRRYLTLLEHHVTIVDGADESHALGIYAFPDIDRPSLFGRLVSSAKYGRNRGEHFDSLFEEYLAFIMAHPRYLSATHIAAPPPNRPSGSSSLARTLAKELGSELGMALITIHGPERQPRKANASETDCSDVANKFAVHDDLGESSLLIVDDLYGFGCTVSEACRATRAAGADSVLALTATKNARGCQGLWPDAANWPGSDVPTFSKLPTAGERPLE